MNLAEISKEIYEDGLNDGFEKGKIEAIKKLLTKKLKCENNEICMLMEDASIEKIEEIEDNIFEFNSWNEVYDILTNFS